MRNYSERAYLFSFAAISALILGAALIGQYGFKLYPCHLCLLQRYPYMVVIAIGVLGGIWLRPDYHRWALLTCTLLFFVGAGIAFYHSGVEQGWFPGPQGCTVQPGTIDSLDVLRANILHAPLVTCDQAQAKMLGLTLAAWNTLAYMTLSLVAAMRTFRSFSEKR